MTSTSIDHAALALLLAVAGCSSGGAALHHLDGGSDPPVDDGSFALSVESAWYRPAIGPVVPAARRTFADLTVTLENRFADPPVAANPAWFSATTESALSVPSDPYGTALVGSSCTPDLSVSAGGRVTCHLVFDLPQGDPPKTLVYRDETGHTGSTAIGAVRTPFRVRAGTYQTVDPIPIGCDRYADLRYAFSSLHLQRDATDAFEIKEIGDPAHPGDPLPLPREGNTGDLTVTYYRDSLYGCDAVYADHHTITATADDELDYALDSEEGFRTGACHPEGATCSTTLKLHYRRL
jgi:hypothetical protein